MVNVAVMGHGTVGSGVVEILLNHESSITNKADGEIRVKYILDKVQGWIGGLTKSDVGLGNVNNTSDLAKPVSTATRAELTAINSKVDNLNKGGTSLFAGSGLEKTIPHGLGSIPTSAYAFPKVNPEGYLGEVWVRFDATNIYVGNTGSFTGAMVWGVVK